MRRAAHPQGLLEQLTWSQWSAWKSKHIHLDHMDEAGPHAYNGLAHASCNSRAHANTGPRTDVPPRKWRLTREEFEAEERRKCERSLANHLGGQRGCTPHYDRCVVLSSGDRN